MGANYLFIDGGSMRAAFDEVSHEITGGKGNFVPIYQLLDVDAAKIFYYDAISAQNHGELVPAYEARVQSEHERFDRIRALDRFHVLLGQIKGRSGNRRQKGVDVQLTVDMMTHAFRKNMSSVTLFAGDDDFIPLLEAVVREGITISIWHPAQASEALLSAADIRVPFNFKRYYYLFSRDGHEIAFNLINSGSQGMAPAPLPWSGWHDGEIEYRVAWLDETIHVWRNEGIWKFKILRCKGSTALEAAAAFEKIFGWPIVNQAGRF